MARTLRSNVGMSKVSWLLRSMLWPMIYAREVRVGGGDARARKNRLQRALLAMISGKKKITSTHAAVEGIFHSQEFVQRCDGRQ